eukprot:scaffold207354_cov66-Cyclotella_meneghiniana.AAC.1
MVEKRNILFEPPIEVFHIIVDAGIVLEIIWNTTTATGTGDSSVADQRIHSERDVPNAVPPLLRRSTLLGTSFNENSSTTNEE